MTYLRNSAWICIQFLYACLVLYLMLCWVSLGWMSLCWMIRAPRDTYTFNKKWKISVKLKWPHNHGIFQINPLIFLFIRRATLFRERACALLKRFFFFSKNFAPWGFNPSASCPDLISHFGSESVVRMPPIKQWVIHLQWLRTALKAEVRFIWMAVLLKDTR